MDFWQFMFGFKIVDDNTADTFFRTTGIWICIATLVLVVAILAVICLSNRRNTFNVMALAFAAVCIGASFGLSYLAPITMPQGGSVTIASLLPICLYAYIFGFKRGLLAGIIYSILQIIQKPYVLNFTQTLLDYILAYSTVSLCGLAPILASKLRGRNAFCNFLARFDFSISLVFVAIAKFTFHYLAGIIFYASFAPEGMSPFIYSLVYNSVVFADMALCIIPAVVLQLSNQFMRYIKQVRAKVTGSDKLSSSESTTAPDNNPQ